METPPSTDSRCAWDASLRQRDIVDGPASTAYVIGGTGRPIVFLHDFGSTAAEWAPVLHRLSADHMTVAVDLPGHGRSDVPSQEYTPEVFLTWLNNFLARMELSDVTLVGCGFGAGLALALVTHGSARIRDLVLVGPSIPGTQPAGSAMYWIFWLAHQPRLRHLFPRLLPRWIDRAQRESVADNVLPEPLSTTTKAALQRRSVCAAQESCIRHWHDWLEHRPTFGQVVVPVLLLWGRRDILYPIRHSRLLRTLIPQSKLSAYDDNDHWPHLQRPADVAATLREFSGTSPPTS